MRATPALAKLLGAIVAGAEADHALTLGEARRALLRGTLWSDQGELLHGQDTTAFVLELDELIDRYGMSARAQDALNETLS